MINRLPSVTNASIQLPSSQRGAAVILLLYGLSFFSVIALSLLRNPGLASVMRVSDDPDLHVVLYAGGAGTPRVVGRLNLPNTPRSDLVDRDDSVIINAPGPVGSDLAAELEADWAYAVQLSPTLRVCCDAGDDACGSIESQQQLPQGSITPATAPRINATATEHQLRFALSSYDVPPNHEIPPTATLDAAFMLKAARLLDVSQVEALAEGTTDVACRLVAGEQTLATGLLKLRPGTDKAGRINRVSSGTLELTYKASAK